MNKESLLEVIKQMLTDWQDSYNSRNRRTVLAKNCFIGFCSWVINYEPKNIVSWDHPLINELMKDTKRTVLIGFWYETFADKDNFETLLPRIDHLKRTIARLEKEIELEQTKPLEA